MNATRFSASLAILVVLGSCAQPRETAVSTAASSQSAEPVAMSATTQTAVVGDRDAFWGQLTRRFDQPPFALDYLHRQRGEMVATYDGGLGTYIACGASVGAADPAGATNADRLNSRLVVRVAEGSGGASSVSTDVIHVVRLAGAPTVLAVRPGAPASTGDGRFCWSTGAMERFALAP